MHPISIRSENNEDVNNTNGSQQNDDSQEETESDPRVSELRKTLYAEDHLKTGADQRVTELRKTMSSGELNSLGKGTAKVDHAASGSSTLTGAKRRKIGNPGRWPQVSPSPAAGNEPGFVADSIGANGQIGAETPNSVQSSRSPRNNVDAEAIVKINKPNTIMTTMKNGTPSIRLMFSVERVDGTEVTVSNEFLKDCFPDLYQKEEKIAGISNVNAISFTYSIALSMVNIRVENFWKIKTYSIYTYWWTMESCKKTNAPKSSGEQIRENQIEYKEKDSSKTKVIRTVVLAG
ncbi:hypothetical protein ACFE04_004796 [Oxalis oulophora]